MRTLAKERSARRVKTYRPRPGDHVIIGDEVFTVPTSQMLRDFNAIENGTLQFETVDTVDDLFAACGIDQ